MSKSLPDLAARAGEFREAFARLRREVGRVVAGQDEVVDGALTCLFVGGHCLLEGVPGLGKTLVARTLAAALDLEFSRIQFTPDLMPADITGTAILREDGRGGREFAFQPGPVFAQIVLADEINRAGPKTQSALLEAMQERAVTAGGQTRALPEPFFVLATQNPLEMEGTYPLPEAQLDRFMMKLVARYPGPEELAEILERGTGAEEPVARKVMGADEILAWRRAVREVLVAPAVRDRAIRLVLATHPENENAPPEVGRFVRYGASPRAARALILAAKARALLDGRFNAAYEDLAAAALPCLRHRLILDFEAEAEGVDADEIVASVLRRL